MIQSPIIMEYYPEHTESPLFGTYLVTEPGRACVLTDDIQILITVNNRAVHGDTVYYKLNNSTVAQVTGIKVRTETRIPGVLLTMKTKIIGFNRKGMPIYEFVPVDWRYPHFYVASSIKRNTSNQYVLIQFKEWERTQKSPSGVCLDILGRLADPLVEHRVALYNNNIYHRSHSKDPRFEELTRKSTQASTRVDFQDQYVFSIDPEGCTDIDDAVSVLESDCQTTVLVHIADVDSIFPQDNFYEPEIQRRLTTVYSIKRYHMLPAQYSSGLSSLLEGETRNVVTARFTYDCQGLLVSREFLLGKIKSRSAISYERADEILLSGQSGELGHALNRLARLFGTRDSHKIVEHLMIQTNSFAAEYTANLFIRSHQSSGEHTIIPPHSILEYVKFRTESSARYSAFPHKHVGHDLLGLSYYTHFTSPIRRYADLVMHRLVKARIQDQLDPYRAEELVAIADELNTYNRRVKKFYRDQTLLDAFQKINTAGGIVQTAGYLVSYQDRYVYIYIPLYSMEYKYRICTPDAESLLHVDVTDYSLTITSNNGHSIKYEIYQELDVVLTTDNQALRFLNKIKMRIPGIVGLIS